MVAEVNQSTGKRVLIKLEPELDRRKTRGKDVIKEERKEREKES